MQIRSIVTDIESSGIAIGCPQILITIGNNLLSRTMSITEILQEIIPLKLERISICGDGVMDQDDLYALINQLKRRDYIVNLCVDGKVIDKTFFAKVDQLSINVPMVEDYDVAILESIVEGMIDTENDLGVQLICECNDEKEFDLALGIYFQMTSKKLLMDYQMVLTVSYDINDKINFNNTLRMIEARIIDLDAKVRLILKQG